MTRLCSPVATLNTFRRLPQNLTQFVESRHGLRWSNLVQDFSGFRPFSLATGTRM